LAKEIMMMKFAPRRVALAVAASALLGITGVGPADAVPVRRCDTKPCLVEVYAQTRAYSTPYLKARSSHAVRPGKYVVTCEAKVTSVQPSGRYANPWWSRTREGTWINNGDLKGGEKMYVGDCVAPPNDGLLRGD
jgi:hypothetical protein